MVSKAYNCFTIDSSENGAKISSARNLGRAIKKEGTTRASTPSVEAGSREGGGVTAGGFPLLSNFFFFFVLYLSREGEAIINFALSTTNHRNGFEPWLPKTFIISRKLFS